MRLPAQLALVDSRLPAPIPRPQCSARLRSPPPSLPAQVQSRWSGVASGSGRAPRSRASMLSRLAAATPLVSGTVTPAARIDSSIRSTAVAARGSSSRHSTAVAYPSGQFARVAERSPAGCLHVGLGPKRSPGLLPGLLGPECPCRCVGGVRRRRLRAGTSAWRRGVPSTPSSDSPAMCCWGPVRAARVTLPLSVVVSAPRGRARVR